MSILGKKPIQLNGSLLTPFDIDVILGRIPMIRPILGSTVVNTQVRSIAEHLISVIPMGEPIFDHTLPPPSLQAINVGNNLPTLIR